MYGKENTRFKCTSLSENQEEELRRKRAVLCVYKRRNSFDEESSSQPHLHYTLTTSANLDSSFVQV